LAMAPLKHFILLLN